MSDITQKKNYYLDATSSFPKPQTEIQAKNRNMVKNYTQGTQKKHVNSSTNSDICSDVEGCQAVITEMWCLQTQKKP